MNFLCSPFASPSFLCFYILTYIDIIYRIYLWHTQYFYNHTLQKEFVQCCNMLKNST